MTQPTATTLVYDKDVSGHHLDYLQFLVEYLAKMPDTVRQFFVFVLHPAAQRRFGLYQNILRFHYISELELAQFNEATSVLKRATAEFSHLTHLTQQYQAKRVFFMHIDAFQIELGKAQNWHWSFKMSGILFLPFRKQYEDGSTAAARLKRLLRGQRKQAQISWMLQNPHVERIFFLNDNQGVAQYNARFKPVFDYLPDPIDQTLQIHETADQLKLIYGIPASKTVFLIYGHLSPRKNIPHIAEAVALLSEPEQAQICLLVCGEAEESYEDTLQDALQILRNKCPLVEVITHFRFFDPVATHQVIKLTDVVLVPYIHFFSSSNILGLAAKFNKPLVASRLGVVGELVEQYQLGQTVDPESPAAISEALQNSLKRLGMVEGLPYLAAHSTEVFCQKILGFIPFHAPKNG